MIVIADSNVVISALISPHGGCAQIFKAKSKLQFIAPRYIIEEIKNHFPKIEALSVLKQADLRNELKRILERIRIVETDTIPKKYLYEAFKIISDIDYDDVFFVALNRYKKYKIWTLDMKLKNGLEKKGYHICVTTKEVREKLYK